ncbi:MAG: DNA-3-methyladenine glycosylase I [Bdellovibrionales bacterium]|nr:DNA-3-methyladenine glycosylase I [Bdellovibrionales bacterium]
MAKTSTKEKPKVKIQPRCSWAGTDPLYVKYHDTEWGVPVHDDQKLFEFLVLESAQAGLSWITILRKRENYRKAFAGFDPKKVARFNEKKIAALLQNEGIIRNNLKIRAAINNAQRFLEIQKEFGSFAKYMWAFVDHKPIQNKRKPGTIPATTEISDALAKDMKKRGFKFLGSTVLYAHMQAVGMVNDHVTSCLCYKKLS